MPARALAVTTCNVFGKIFGNITTVLGLPQKFKAKLITK